MTAREIAFLVMVLCAPGLAAAQVVDLSRPLPADKDTICLFHLDDVGNPQVQDAVGGNPGRAEGAVPTIGRFGGALSCNGVGGWIDVPDCPDTAPQDGITVECWVKFRDKAAGDIICRNGGYMIRVGGTIRAMFGIDGTWRSLGGATAVPVGRWTHLAITYDVKSKQARIYIDGRLDVAGEPGGITAGELRAGLPVLRIGSNDWSEASAVLDGKLDEVRVSSVARTYSPLYASVAEPVPKNTNLVDNASFESGMYGWRITREGNGQLLWHVESGDAARGRAFLRASEPGANSIISYPFRIARGMTHTVSATMRAEGPCRGVLRLRLTGTGGRGLRATTADSFTIAQNWQRFSVSFSVPDDSPTEEAYVEVGTRDDVRVDIDAVSVVAGEQAEYTQTEAQSVGLNAALPPQRTYMLGGGAPLPVEVTNTADTDRNLALACVVTDWLGRQVHRQELTLGPVAAGQAVRAQMELPDKQVGWFVAHFAVSQNGKVLKQTDRPFNVIEPMKGVGEVMDSPLGMNTHMEREPTEHLNDNMRMLSLCGVKWIRAWWGWGMAEKQPGQFDWGEYDRQLEAVHGAGMEIMPILLRYYPQFEQEWAGEVDRIQRIPRDLNQWAAFVQTTAARYRGRVKVWEVWNEPNYTMEADYYAKLVKATYDAIKAADPDAVVVGFGGTDPDYIRRVFEAGSVKCMDAVSIHSYSELVQPFERMANLAAAVNDLVQKFGSAKRVWHTEQGSQSDGMGYRASEQTEEQCAVNVAQGYLSALASGVEKFFWFSAQTTPTYGWAVFYEDYVPRPRLVALNGLARLLKGRSVTGRMVLGDGEVACVLMDGKAGAAAALWNLQDTMAVRLPAGTQAAWTDMLSNPVETEAPSGPIELRLGRPVYLLTATPGAERLADILKRADVRRLVPVQVTAARAADGKLKITLRSDSARNLDLRLSVQAPDLFAGPVPSVGIADIAPEETRSLTFEPARAPAAGTEVPVTVQVEVGSHGVYTITSAHKVQF